MQVNDLTSIDPNVDYAQILPIQQKRTIAFFNHFVMNTVSFLNKFAQSCESRLMEFENKLQKVEASLLILEAQLSSISGLGDNNETEIVADKIPDENIPEVNNLKDNLQEESEAVKPLSDGVRASDHPEYQRFFKMLQFGVPAEAVKNKMRIEGADPAVLDTPSKIIPAPPAQVKNEGTDSDTS